MTSGCLMAFNPRANSPNKRKMVLRGWGIFPYLLSLSCAPTRHQTQHPRQGNRSSYLGWRIVGKMVRHQPRKLLFGLPSSSRSPMRFAVSLSRDAAAKMMTPTDGSTKGMPSSADTSPAIFPARLRYLSDFMTTGGFVNEQNMAEISVVAFVYQLANFPASLSREDP